MMHSFSANQRADVHQMRGDVRWELLSKRFPDQRSGWDARKEIKARVLFGGALFFGSFLLGKQKK